MQRGCSHGPPMGEWFGATRWRPLPSLAKLREAQGSTGAQTTRKPIALLA